MPFMPTIYEYKTTFRNKATGAAFTDIDEL